MKTTILTSFFALLLLVIVPSNSKSQIQLDSLNLYQLETFNGNIFLGNILLEDESIIEFNTGELGIIKFPKRIIKELQKVEKKKVIEGKLWFENPQASRYFWSPNGYGLKKGEGYYQNIWVLWNQASIGITDNFSVGFGVIPLFLFGGGDDTPVWIVPKLSVPVIKEKLNLGAGVIAGTIGFQEDMNLGIAYGIATYGNRNNNITAGLGYGYAGGEWASSPLINISAMVRLSSKTYFLTENYMISIDDQWMGLISLGARSIISKVGLDYGLFIPMSNELDQFIALPWLGLTIPFYIKSKT
jgi:hypothetical protein